MKKDYQGTNDQVQEQDIKNRIDSYFTSCFTFSLLEMLVGKVIIRILTLVLVQLDKIHLTREHPFIWLWKSKIQLKTANNGLFATYIGTDANENVGVTVKLLFKWNHNQLQSFFDAQHEIHDAAYVSVVQGAVDFVENEKRRQMLTVKQKRKHYVDIQQTKFQLNYYEIIQFCLHSKLNRSCDIYLQ